MVEAAAVAEVVASLLLSAMHFTSLDITRKFQMRVSVAQNSPESSTTLRTTPESRESVFIHDEALVRLRGFQSAEDWQVTSRLWRCSAKQT
jgi:hypothetical protein